MIIQEGFHREDASLDMRMNNLETKQQKTSLIPIQKELSDIFYNFGELIHNKTCRNISYFRKKKPIKTTNELCEIIKKLLFQQ